MNYLARVVQAVPGDNPIVYAYFSDESIRHADIKPLIAKGSVFAQLADPNFFQERLTVMNVAAAWDTSGTHDPSDCIDLDPCQMHETAPAVTDPLEHIAWSKPRETNSTGFSSPPRPERAPWQPASRQLQQRRSYPLNDHHFVG